MRRRLLGNRRGGEDNILVNPVLSFDKTVDLNAKFGIDNILDCRFSRDYQYFVLFTQNSTRNQHILNVVDINDVNTWTLNNSGYLADWRGGHINNDGTKIYGGITSVLQRNLSTPYNLSSQSAGGSLSVSVVGGVNMNPDETKLFVTKFTILADNSEIREYDLVTPGNISGATLVQTKSISPSGFVNEKSFAWANEGNAILTGYDSDSFRINLRTVSTPYTLNDLSAPTTITSNVGYTSGVEINADQTKIYSVRNSAITQQSITSYI